MQRYQFTRHLLVQSLCIFMVALMLVYRPTGVQSVRQASQEVPVHRQGNWKPVTSAAKELSALNQSEKNVKSANVTALLLALAPRQSTLNDTLTWIGSQPSKYRLVSNVEKTEYQPKNEKIFHSRLQSIKMRSNHTEKLKQRQSINSNPSNDIEVSGSNISEMVAPSNEQRRAAYPLVEPSDESGEPNEPGNFDGSDPDEESQQASGADEPEQSAFLNNGPRTSESRPVMRTPTQDGRKINPAIPLSSAEQEAHQRREQEAAEASEAELADRSALDEQQQTQREIILAQAQSEAKAIKEQQESLMKQQLMQQQMISRRHQEIEGNRSRERKPKDERHKANVVPLDEMRIEEPLNRRRYQNPHLRSDQKHSSTNSRRQHLRKHQHQHQDELEALLDSAHRVEKADSADLPDQMGMEELGQAPSNRDEVYDYPMSQQKHNLNIDSKLPQFKNRLQQLAVSSLADRRVALDVEKRDLASKLDAVLEASAAVANSKYDSGVTEARETDSASSSGNIANDLEPAAQHSYGMNYGSIGAHQGHKDYYQ